MVDFDGDCLSDLFITIQEEDNPGKQYYEILLRREVFNSDDGKSGTNSFCLVQYEDISGTDNH